GTSRAAAELAIFQGNQREARNYTQELSRLRTDLLRVAEVARVMVGRLQRQRVLWGNRAKSDQEFRDVLDLGCESLCFRAIEVFERVAVLLQHRATAGRVDDDRVEGVGIEGRDVRSCEFERRLLEARVIVNCPATALARGNTHVAAVFL